MTEKFTPGEWVVEEHELAVGDCEMVGFRIMTDGKIICAARSNNLKNKPEMQANAALIAAAPEMYKVLEQLHGALRSVPILQAEIEKVMKKARGEE